MAMNHFVQLFYPSTLIVKERNALPKRFGGITYSIPEITMLSVIFTVHYPASFAFCSLTYVLV